MVRLAEENRHLRELVTRAKSDERDAAQALHGELVRARTEVAELEGKARAAAAQKLADAAALAANHDPEKGLARLEDFRDVGRGTPAAALQTAVWAALTGDERALAAALSVTGGARDAAEEVLAHFPAEARAKYPTVESLAALVVAGEILKADAAQLTGTVMTDAAHATVSVRLVDPDDEETVPMALGPDGWQVVVPKKLITALMLRLHPPPAAPLPPKK